LDIWEKRQQIEVKRSADIVTGLGSSLIRRGGDNIHKEGMSQEE